MARDPGILARGPWRTAQVQARWREEPFIAHPDADAEADAAIAALNERGSPSFDGLAARMAGFDSGRDGLTIELEPVRWSLRLGADAMDSLSALCVVRDAQGRWLAGRRADWVASWPGRWALGAGGSVEVGENPAETLTRELAEEWSVTPERMTVEALIRIPSGLAMIVGLARLAEGHQVEMDPEHDTYAWWPSEVSDWPDEADEPLRLMAGLLAS